VEIDDLFGMISGKPTPPERDKLSIAESFRQDLLAFLQTKCDEEHEEKSAAGEPDCLRASGLYKVCGRREAILQLYPEQRIYEKFKVGHRLTFDVGHAVHAWWQNEYLGPMGSLWGEWFCNHCFAVRHRGFMPKRCPECDYGRHRWIEYKNEKGNLVRAKVANILYVEAEYEDHDLGLRYRGHPDGFIAAIGVPTPQFLFELKTISPSGWKRQKDVDPRHVEQTHAYMRLAGVTDALVVYVNKGSQCKWRVTASDIIAGEPNIRVYHVPFDDEKWAKSETKIREHWRAVNTPPADKADVTSWCRACRNPGLDMSPGCPVREQCWSWDAIKP
jgi:hypothetical protein